MPWKVLAYITPPDSFKNKVKSKTAVSRVTGGLLTKTNVAFELERLIPGGCRWSVEETGMNTFRTVFQSKVEPQHLVEWEVLHTMFPGITLRIEEGLSGNEIKYVMPMVWVQFTGLPKEL